MRFIKFVSLIAIAVVFLFSCTGTADNQLSSEEKESGWILLFDGKTMNGWHVYGKGNVPSNWKVDSGELFRNPKDTFGIAKQGNSGVFVDVQEAPSMHHAWESGPEYQLLDSSHIDYKIPVKRSGCLYGFSGQKTAVKAVAPGMWNHSRIIQKNGKVQFYLNDVLTAEEDFTSPAWQDTVANTHFKEFPQFGKHTSGHIALQDWGSAVYFKNLKLKPL